MAHERISEEEILVLCAKAVRKFRGEDINLDIKKLKGLWQDFYRIRKGRLRIIVSFDFDSAIAAIEAIDWRGGAYK